MNYQPDPPSEDDAASQHPFPPSPPPSHIYFPPTTFSPLMFPTNSPLASPLSPAPHPLRSNLNPFDQPIGSPFEQRSNLFDSYVHDRSANSPPPQRPLSPAPVENLSFQTGNHGLGIDVPDVEVDEAVMSPQQQISEAISEWPSDYHSPESAEDLCFEDEGLSPLERIYLFCRSKGVLHRSVFICVAGSLPGLLTILFD